MVAHNQDDNFELLPRFYTQPFTIRYTQLIAQCKTLNKRKECIFYFSLYTNGFWVWLLLHKSLVDWHTRPVDSQFHWLVAVAIRSRVLVQRTFLPPSLAWLRLIKAFCWNKVIIHLAISQFPHNYPPASQMLTRANTHTHTCEHTHTAPAHIHTYTPTQTHFLSDLCHYWTKSA